MGSLILTVNGGSSSLKFAAFARAEDPRRLFFGTIDRIGQTSSTIKVTDAERGTTDERSVAAPDMAAAAAQMLGWLDQRPNLGLSELAGVGHRVVHGGPDYFASQQITPPLVAELHKLCPLDPAHLPGEIALIEACSTRLPAVPQVACFDTAFHHDLPRVAQLLPIPLRYSRTGIRRYGFHGISYAYLMQELARTAGPQVAQGRIVLAHLGSGASMAAVHEGKCLDTTMSFTPTAGLVMGTRSGDLDPGLLIHLARSEGLDPAALDDLVNRQSGLAGLSETSSDVRDLMVRRDTDSRAADALAVFCYQARKWIGALAASLGGLDMLVFSGGVGENSPIIRQEICAALEFLGIELAPTCNARSEATISTAASRCAVRVIRTDEEQMIARDVVKILESRSATTSHH